jgi:CHAT domain-containing protein
MGEWTAAYAAFENAMQVVEEIGRRDILPQVYYRLADWCIRQGEAEKGRAWLETAVAVIEDTREPMHDEGFKISLMGKWQQVYERLVLLCLEMGDTTAAFAWMERARARAFTELLLATDDAVEDVPISTLADVQAVLPNDTLLLCYFTTGVLAHDIPLLQAIPSSNRLREQLLTPARTILLAVRKDKAVLQDCRFDPNLFTTASRRGEEHLLFLDNRVLQQLQNTLLPSADLPTNLVVIPHGPLYRVPFAALLPEVELRFAPSATVLQRGEQTAEVSKTSAISHKRLLAVGYNGTLHGQTLQFTEAEVQTVAGLMGGQAWTGSETKKEQLRQMAESLQYLHIACHGWFNHEQPLESYVETGAGERLTAQEVRQNWRLQAELVTLSACQTGVSAVLRGDEPMGLIRAFLSAGARAVLVSQWPVADLPTFLLMQNFYGRLQTGTPISRALQQTQKWLRELTVAQAMQAVREVMPDEAVRALALVELGQLGETAVPFAKPQFWAAFVVVNGR